MSGRMANPAPKTGHEPNSSNFFSHMDTEHTSIHLPDINRNCPHDCDATIVTTEDLDVPRHSGASSSSKLLTVSKLGSLRTRLTKVLADYNSFDSRNSIRVTCADLDRETVVSTLFRSDSKEKRDRDQNVVHRLRDRQHLHKIFERKVDSAVRGEIMAQRQLYEAEAEVEARNWERRNFDFAFQEINQEFESQRFQLHQARRWAYQAQRDKICLY